jgi:hypothetical protein
MNTADSADSDIRGKLNLRVTGRLSLSFVANSESVNQCYRDTVTGIRFGEGLGVPPRSPSANPGPEPVITSMYSRMARDNGRQRRAWLPRACSVLPGHSD